MSHKFSFFLVVFFPLIINSQTNIINYVGAEFLYSSYGRGNHTNIGAGVDISKELNEFNSVGISLNYFSDDSESISFVDPYTHENYVFIDKLKHFKVFTYFQYTPLNTKNVDIGINLGPTFGILNHQFWQGGYHNDHNNQMLVVDVYDDGSKGFSFGFETDLLIRFEFSHFYFAPVIKIGTDLNNNSYNSLLFNVGYKM